MARPPLYEWHGKEYSFGDKGADWFWALGIIAVAAMIACVLFNQILLGLVILAASITVALQAAKRPRMHRYQVLEDGIAIDTTFYPYSRMMHFSVIEYLDQAIPPALSIKTKIIMAPHLLIPIIDHDPVELYEYISIHLPEGKHDESAMDRIVDLLRL